VSNEAINLLEQRIATEREASEKSLREAAHYAGVAESHTRTAVECLNRAESLESDLRTLKLSRATERALCWPSGTSPTWSGWSWPAAATTDPEPEQPNVSNEAINLLEQRIATEREASEKSLREAAHYAGVAESHTRTAVECLNRAESLESDLRTLKLSRATERALRTVFFDARTTAGSDGAPEGHKPNGAGVDAATPPGLRARRGHRPGAATPSKTLTRTGTMATETLPVNDWAPPAPSPAPPPAPGVGRFGEPWGISSEPDNVTIADGADSLLELPEEERAAVIHARVRRSVVCVNAMNGIAFPAGLSGPLARSCAVKTSRRASR
jgi:hypothetical protein